MNGQILFIRRLGSTVALANSNDTILVTYSYEPSGEVQIRGPNTNPYQYAGRENDGNGLYNYRSRYFSPLLNRLVSADPLGLSAGLNEYAYVSNNAILFNDPLGLTCAYSQNSGNLTCTDRNDHEYLSCTAYAGIGTGLNNPNAKANSSLDHCRKGGTR